ncbi:delta-60 repeat domain-containing protein, partial [Escherichia coli]|uniref:delta-60 repeat domain-containing protein n=1 Tax=Escherichia coli TaxID=562 RepID=UPI0028E05876
LVRYLPDGRLDESFGDGGVARGDSGNRNDVLADIVLQPDGKILVAGSTKGIEAPARARHNFAVARFNPDGSLDPTFGDGGV